MSDNKTPLGEFAERSTYEVVVDHMSDEDLRDFVLGFCDGHIFTSAQIRECDGRLLPCIFMPVALGLFKEHTDAEMRAKIEEIGVFWEWMREAGPRSINGYPIFFSCRLMHTDDWKRARSTIMAEMARRKNISLSP